MNKRFLIIVLIIFCVTETSVAQNYSRLQWTRVTMDSTYNPVLDVYGKPVNGSKTHDIIVKYKPSVDSLMIVIGYNKEELTKYGPESPLSNLAADMLLYEGNQYLKSAEGKKAKVDFALTNFGGIRTSLPEGDITPYDIMSVFPFNNKLVILDIEGKYVRELMENFAKRGRVEALGGVKVLIEKNELKECLVAGEPLDDNKMYRLVTIDFLLSGGDSVYALKYCTRALDTGIYIRDAVISYIKGLTAQGKEIEGHKDGRVKIIK